MGDPPDSAPNNRPRSHPADRHADLKMVPERGRTCPRIPTRVLRAEEIEVLRQTVRDSGRRRRTWKRSMLIGILRWAVLIMYLVIWS